MRERGLVPCQPRPWRHSLTEAGADTGLIPDLVNRDFTADTPGAKMVGDITYIPTWEGWLFLATVIDCHTKAVIGWAMDDNYKTPLIAAAMEMAARNYSLPPDAIFHSDYAEVLVKPRNPGLATWRGFACVDPRLNDRVCHRRL
jgi:transposase InsO family protein